MKIYILMFLMVFVFAQTQAQCDKKGTIKTEKPEANNTMPDEKIEFKELPDGAKLTDEVREEIKDDDGKVIDNKIITVEEKLRKIGAKYDDGNLVDADGKEIRFYKPPIRGASQGFEEDQKQAKRDAAELMKLQEEFRVIILYVNPLKFS